MLLHSGQLMALASEFSTVESIKALDAAPRRPVRSPGSGYVEVVEHTGLMRLDESARTRERVRRATFGDASAIVIYCDSPGGDVHGTAELAEAIKRAAEAKPVYVIIEGWCCSGALWAVCHATRILAAPTATVGSVGCFNVLFDDSEVAKSLGLRVIPVTSSELKITGMSGVPVTDEQIAYVRERVEFIARWFGVTVAKARRLKGEAIHTVLEGGVFYAERAMKLGLIDGLAPLGFEHELEIIESGIAAGVAQARPAKPAEPYAGLYGQAAIDMFDELVDAATPNRNDIDAWNRSSARISEQYPALAAAVDAAEAAAN